MPNTDIMDTFIASGLNPISLGGPQCIPNMHNTHVKTISGTLLEANGIRTFCCINCIINAIFEKNLKDILGDNQSMSEKINQSEILHTLEQNINPQFGSQCYHNQIFTYLIFNKNEKKFFQSRKLGDMFGDCEN